jgi:hypothetical protein
MRCSRRGRQRRPRNFGRWSAIAEDFALKERGITKLRDGVQIAPIETVVDHLEAGHKTLWH